MEHREPLSQMLNRRELLRRTATGVPLTALYGLLASESVAAKDPARDGSSETTVSPPHHTPRAKSVIFLFMGGGPSQVDLFDPKPEIAKHKTIPIELPHIKRDATANCMPSPYTFRRHGESGIWMSELLPHLAPLADELCVIRSMTCDHIEPSGALKQFLTGDGFFPRPSIGAWILYGLGSEAEDLPGFVFIDRQVNAPGKQLYGSRFLPVAYEGTFIRDLGRPVDNLELLVPGRVQSNKLDLLRHLNEKYRRGREEDSRLDARIASYELAFRMQTAAPQAFDLSQESAATHKLYGIGEKITDDYARKCLLARRLVERGVRFVVVNIDNQWDHHAEVRDHEKSAAATDQPVAALLKDLRSRGLLDETLVVWGGEFGRTPTAQSKGRDHHPYGFTMWMVGGGMKRGVTHGATDDFGFFAVEDKVHVHDLHATILHLLGIDHQRLTYSYSGRDFRLTDVAGNVLHDLLV